ncbi:MAG TPA: roadblock/LC7 domain-containing protein [Candidatus Methanoperedens sp.]
MVTKAELYLLALQELEKTTGNIEMSALVTRDGLIMSCTSANNILRETCAAYGAATFMRANDTMEELAHEKINILIYESGNHRVVTLRVADALLVALTGKDVQMGIVLLEIQKTAQKLKELMT